jgi:uncharacterized protein (DUF488 family)
MPKKYQLMTTGYAGETPTSFVTKLREHGIETVVDVRELPLSRKKGFSKSALAEVLQLHGIDYVHHRELGVPKPLRNKLRAKDVALNAYFDAFREHLTEYAPLLDEMYNLAQRSRCCLICVEEYSDECHRSVVAESIVARNGRSVEIVHI